MVTGAASGIGRALATDLAGRGAAGVVVADLNGDLAGQVAERIGGLAVACDVGDPAAIDALVATTTDRFGRVDLFCSNAGYVDRMTFDLAMPIEGFERIVRVHTLSHVAAAQAVLPGMLARGRGYLLQTVSSAGLLAGPAPAGYTLSKFGAIGFAEWLAVTYRSRGIGVSCLCPNAVYTGLFGRPKDLDAPVELPSNAMYGEMLLPEDVAVQTIDAIEGPEPFLVLPHPSVGEHLRDKVADYDAWIASTASTVDHMRQNWPPAAGR